ncbi:MAG TPA: hypothetical protein VLA16_19035 [Ideonella sp.]|uniref:hypothetical protein n=1 Tax=Ideonella sp. TaxID=1929293 RepID=UPI002BF56863|nr:hypothetical protein [Ideonella sp.]
MWKLLVGFILFAAVGLWLLSKAGDKIDMGGEKHDVSGGHADAASAPAPALAASQ